MDQTTFYNKYMALINQNNGVNFSDLEKEKMFENFVFKQVWNYHFNKVVEDCEKREIQEPDEKSFERIGFVEIYTIACIIVDKIKDTDLGTIDFIRKTFMSQSLFFI